MDNVRAALNPILNPPEFRPGAGLTDEMLADKLGGVLSNHTVMSCMSKDLADDLKYIPERLRWLSERLDRYEEAFGFHKLNALEVTVNLKQLKERLFITDLLAKNGFAITHTIGRTDAVDRAAEQKEPPVMLVETKEEHVRRFISREWLDWMNQFNPGLTYPQVCDMAIEKMVKEVFPDEVPRNLKTQLVDEDSLEVVMSATTVTRF